MISASRLNAILEELDNAVQGIKSHRWVVDQEHFAKLVDDMYADDFPCVLGVLPDADMTSRSLDNQKFNNKLLFFFVKKVDQKERDANLTTEVYDETLSLVNAFLSHVYSSSSSSPCNLLSKIEWSTLDIKPEYNFASCDGYSISFNLETKKLES